MANTIIGKIQSIGVTVNVSKKEKAYYKRELVLNASRFDPYTGEERTNILTIPFAQKNCEKLDAFKVGDFVEISFVLQGREYTPEGGSMKYITDVVGYNIIHHQISGSQGAENAPQAPAAPSAPQAPSANPFPAQAPAQPQAVPQQQGGGDLPF